MVDMPVEKHIAERIEAIARDEQRPVNDVLTDMLAQYSPPREKRSDWARRMARMAEEDTSSVWDGFAPDLATRSCEILEDEFGYFELLP
jgi:hypothetical protein